MARSAAVSDDGVLLLLRARLLGVGGSFLLLTEVGRELGLLDGGRGGRGRRGAGEGALIVEGGFGGAIFRRIDRVDFVPVRFD